MRVQIDMLQPSAFLGLSLLRDFNKIHLDQLPLLLHPGPGRSGAHPRSINSGSLHFHSELVVTSILFCLPVRGSLCHMGRTSSSSRKSSCVGFPCIKIPRGKGIKLETFPPLKKKKLINKKLVWTYSLNWQSVAQFILSWLCCAQGGLLSTGI